MRWTSSLNIAFFSFILYLYQSVKDVQIDHCKDINHYTQTSESILLFVEKWSSHSRLKAAVVTSKESDGRSRKIDIVILYVGRKVSEPHMKERF